MIEVSSARFKTQAFAHQVEGVLKLVTNDSFALFDEMGAGKSKQVIDAACCLAEARKIDAVVVVAPASVRCVWTNAEMGEIKKHAWDSLSVHVYDYHRTKRLVWGNSFALGKADLPFFVANYEFLRSANRLKEFLIALRSYASILLVLDESSYIKKHTTQQAKAIKRLRQHCARCVLLNGTPVTNSPLDLYSQMNILSEKVLRNYKNFYHFRSHYCVMGGFENKQVVKHINLDKLSKLVAPYVLRRLKKDCMDLPEKLYTQREIALTDESWRRYKELKRDAIITLSQNDMRIEPNGAVRIMRLAQLTSGILGGFPVAGEESELLSWEIVADSSTSTQDLSFEKMQFAIEYLQNESTAQAVIVWCRWRRERERLYEALAGYSIGNVYQIYGGQSQKERERAVERFSSVNGAGRCILLAQPHAGGLGLNLVAATEAVYLSNDFSLSARLQSEDRCHRAGQRHAVTYVDVLATGPNGQQTVDHAIIKALRKKEDIAAWTAKRWVRELQEEDF